jgi:hypothetical protein
MHHQFIQRFETIKLNEAISNRAITLLRDYRLSHGLRLLNNLQKMPNAASSLESQLQIQERGYKLVLQREPENR